MFLNNIYKCNFSSTEFRRNSVDQMRIIQEGALSLQLLVREFCECKVPHARCSKNVKNAHLGLYTIWSIKWYLVVHKNVNNSQRKLSASLNQYIYTYLKIHHAYRFTVIQGGQDGFALF